MRRHIYGAKDVNSSHRVQGLLVTTMAKIDEHVNNLPGTFYSKRRARLRHARALHNFKHGHGWIEHNMCNKTSLVNISRLCIELMMEAGLHGNKI